MASKDRLKAMQAHAKEVAWVAKRLMQGPQLIEEDAENAAYAEQVAIRRAREYENAVHGKR